ncbi:B3/4 domain-containing protein [Mycolicibacterium sp. P9-22]|uniref:B3/B4 domain-containing protein n=1 Tax=Mycolicibacterium sp. P9-22 TaxID=2024613 RepID=UPI001D153563|nr:phenylalanine--tRNA ligase beta subunit-related protein [Mycolicibacterium sp. P9-22]
MDEVSSLTDVVDHAYVDDAVFALRPDYRAVVMAARGIVPGPTDEVSEALLCQAESMARKLLGVQAAEDLPHIAAWREAFRAFGAKPQRTRNSVEALTRRVQTGLPRVNRLTDIYNAVSVIHQLPIGGEDLSRYVGAPRLIRATGEETFDTTAGGTDVVEHPDAGEVVWCDDAGVTCRRWNWRQARRTQLSEHTTTALFILDALDPMSDRQLLDAADELDAHIRRLGPDVQTVRRVLSKSSSAERD